TIVAWTVPLRRPVATTAQLWSAAATRRTSSWSADDGPRASDAVPEDCMVGASSLTSSAAAGWPPLLYPRMARAAPRVKPRGCLLWSLDGHNIAQARCAGRVDAM